MDNKTFHQSLDLSEIGSTITSSNSYFKESTQSECLSHLLLEFVRDNKDRFNQGVELNKQSKKDLISYLENNNGYQNISPNAYAILNWDYQDFLILPTENNPKYTNVHLTGNFFFEIYLYVAGRQEYLADAMHEFNQYKSLGFGSGLVSAAALMAYNVFTQPTASGMACATIPILAFTALGFVGDEIHKRRLRRQNNYLEGVLTGPMAGCVTTGSLAIEKALGIYEP